MHEGGRAPRHRRGGSDLFSLPVGRPRGGCHDRLARFCRALTDSVLTLARCGRSAAPRFGAESRPRVRVLWIRGMVAALSTPAVAIVGARAASPYALAVAQRLAADLAVAGLTIVSGLARGVDAAAHRGALSAGGTPIAVLG